MYSERCSLLGSYFLTKLKCFSTKLSHSRFTECFQISGFTGLTLSLPLSIHKWACKRGILVCSFDSFIAVQSRHQLSHFHKEVNI